MVTGSRIIKMSIQSTCKTVRKNDSKEHEGKGLLSTKP